MSTASRRAALSGVLAAGVALALTEMVSAPGNRGPSLISAVGSRFIDRFGGPLKDLAVSLFGTNDKRALVVGIVAACLVIGAVMGRVALTRRAVGVAGIAGIGLVGLWAGLLDPLASTTRMLAAAAVGVFGGSATLLALLARAAAAADAPPRSRNAEPTVTEPSRRAFLGFAGGAAAVAVGGTLAARALRSAAGGARAAANYVLPRPTRAVPPPATQPFSVAGLSPYVTPNADFYRIDTALFVPRVNPSTWKLRVDGMVEHPFEVSYNELLAMDLVEEPVTLQCVSNEVGGSYVGNASWLGVPLDHLLDRAGVKPGATQLVGRSVDAFTVGFPTEVARDGRTALVAVGMNGEALPERHGYPARLIVAGLYGYVSATKWLKQIELTRWEDFDAYWVPRGWAKQAPIKTASRIDVPRAGDELRAGTVAIAGVAWAPTHGISRVEVRVDDGPWREAQLGDAASNNTWVQWMTTWQAARGEHVIAVRATDGRGVTQTAAEAPPRPDGATGYHTRRIAVR